MIYAFLVLAAIGHVVFWAALINRVHGYGIERRWIHVATAACALAIVAIPIPLAILFWQRARGMPSIGGEAAWTVGRIYFFFCVLHCLVSAVQRSWLKVHPERRGALLANHTTSVELGQPDEASMFARGIPTLLGRVPGNQVLDVRVHEKQLAIPRLPASSDGLRIAHLSDFHMSGRIAKTYHESVVEQVNTLAPDLIAITGDLVEHDKCLDWLPDTLGQLRAPAGVYFVRGNHDRRVDNERMLASLAELGLIHLGSSSRQITVRETPILLAGSELPWFGTAPDLSASTTPRVAGVKRSERPETLLRILLAHGPDQFTWAQDHDFDLVLAGHNHGGQVRLPLLGPILAPSLSGTRYACGVYRRGDTVMHVSRGTGSLTPFRWNCPPEIALLVLRPGSPPT